MKLWMQDSLERILPETEPVSKRKLAVSGGPGEVISFQVGLRPSKSVTDLKVELTGSFAKRSSVRIAGLVPLKHRANVDFYGKSDPDTPDELTEGYVPGFVPDPLLEIRDQKLDSDVSRALWITVKLPAKPVDGDISVTVLVNGKETGKVSAVIKVWPFKLAKSKLRVSHYLYTDALVAWYKIEPFSKRYWQLVEKYFKNMAAHGQNVIYTPMFTPPLDAEKIDIQLVDVRETEKGKYSFGWTKFLRWFDLAKKCGIEYFEMSHLVSQWGAKYAIRILVEKDGKVKPLCGSRYPVTGNIYRNFLEQFLPALIKFLKRQRLYKKTIFHLSDEPHIDHIEQYRKVREMIRSIAPEIKISDSISDYDFYKTGLIEDPIPVIDKVPDFIKNGVRPCIYYCCIPRGKFPNRFLGMPMQRVRILGLILFRFQLKGFLHWGANYWFKSQTTELIDPFHVNDGLFWPTWMDGDTFVLYPGEDGPIDSIRWENYRDAFDDYRLLQTAASKVGTEKVLKLLEDIRDFDDYPLSPDYIRKVRIAAAKLLM